MIYAYLKYIKNFLVNKHAEENKHVKGDKTGAVGRPTILPEQVGHEFRICGDTEYCLGCGRSTKAKHIDIAKHVFWRRQICTPVLRLGQYQEKQHKVGFLNWWYCVACEAKGPEMNKQFCASYSHKRGKHLDSDPSDDENDDQYPGTKTRNEAYLRIVENHIYMFFIKTRLNNPRC
eukprot:6775993-Heterocapsa_arctica.AAC.1